MGKSQEQHPAVSQKNWPTCSKISWPDPSAASSSSPTFGGGPAAGSNNLGLFSASSSSSTLGFICFFGFLSLGLSLPWLSALCAVSEGLDVEAPEGLESFEDASSAARSVATLLRNVCLLATSSSLAMASSFSLSLLSCALSESVSL